MTTKARTDFFTVMLLPELLTAIAIRTRYISAYITQLPRKAQSPDGDELTDRGSLQKGIACKVICRRLAFAMLS